MGGAPDQAWAPPDRGVRGAVPPALVDTPFILDTDASSQGLGAVLSQMQDGQERVIAYASKTLSKSQKRYCTTYRELLALVLLYLLNIFDITCGDAVLSLEQIIVL